MCRAWLPSGQSMTTKWTENESRAFRRERVHRWRSDYLERAQQRCVDDAARKQEFFHTHDLRSEGAPSPGRKVTEYLEFWAVHSSWSYCRGCKLLVSRKLLPSHARRPVLKYESKCHCQARRYKMPRQYEEIPAVLRGLTLAEMTTLRPLDLHNGEYNRQQHGYQKTSMTRITWSCLSIQKINNLRNPQSKRCLQVYEYLMSAAANAYGAFVSRCEEDIGEGRSINLYNSNDNRGIECALWLCLYPIMSWCETTLSGNDERRSSKASFMTKVFSQIRDYSPLRPAPVLLRPVVI